MSDFAVNPDIGLWERNAVLNGRNTYYVTGDVEGTLSIKTVLSGEGYWNTPNGRYRVDPGSYLVLNRGQRYGVDIRSDEIVETFCMFFRPGFMDSIRETSRRDWDELLLSESETSNSSEFYERLNHGDQSVSPQIEAMRKIVRNGTTSEIEADEVMMRLAHALLQGQQDAIKQRDSLNVAKVSTRDEIYRRLNSARDYMIANLDTKADLAAISHAAALSPFHFHRLFKSAYNQTPHEFLCEIRLAKAKRLLRDTKSSMSEIAWSVGFESQAAFTKFFTRSAGSTPTAYRMQVA